MASAIGGSAALSAGGSIFSSIMGASGSKKQAEAIRYSADKASDTALKLNEKARADLQPFRDLGKESGDLLSGVLKGTTNLDEIFKGSSLFDFEEERGTRSINRQLKARGAYNSGAGLEALSLFNSDLVGKQGNQMWDRLFGNVQLGANAAANQAQNTTQTAGQVAQIESNAGVGIGEAMANQYNAYAQGGQGVAKAGQSGVSNFMNYSLYNPILSRMAGGGGGSRPYDPVFDANDSFSAATFNK